MLLYQLFEFYWFVFLHHSRIRKRGLNHSLHQGFPGLCFNSSVLNSLSLPLFEDLQSQYHLFKWNHFLNGSITDTLHRYDRRSLDSSQFKRNYRCTTIFKNYELLGLKFRFFHLYIQFPFKLFYVSLWWALLEFLFHKR